MKFRTRRDGDLRTRLRGICLLYSYLTEMRMGCWVLVCSFGKATERKVGDKNERIRKRKYWTLVNNVLGVGESQKRQDIEVFPRVYEEEIFIPF